MERLDQEPEETTTYERSPYHGAQQRRRVVFGLLLVGLGGWWMLHRLEIVLFPEWLFTWPVLLIAIGAANLITHKFRSAFGYIMLIVGAFFLLRNHFDFPYEAQRFFWPAMLIIVGLVILLRPRPARTWRERVKKEYPGAVIADERSEKDKSDTIGETIIMGALKKELSNQNFKGGEITCVMGGAEFYLGNSDISGNAVLDITCVMGSVELIVPRGWHVSITATSVLGGIDDKRVMEASGASKTLTITGTILLAGLEIRSA